MERITITIDADLLAFVDRLSAAKGLDLGPARALSKPAAAAGGALSAAEKAEAEATEKKGLAATCGGALKTGHNMIGIVTVAPNDDFTRPQRLTVLLCIVLGQIAVREVATK